MVYEMGIKGISRLEKWAKGQKGKINGQTTFCITIVFKMRRGFFFMETGLLFLLLIFIRYFDLI